jgi:hypothetical protein
MDFPNIAIACPKGARTGGPEALHQLCRQLNDLGVEAFLINTGGANEEVGEYKKYEVAWRGLEDLNSASHLVVPETLAELPSGWDSVFSGKIIVWWLSVDNSGMHYGWENEVRSHPLPSIWITKGSLLEIVRGVPQFFQRIVRRISYLERFLSVDRSKASSIFEKSSHIAQSVYAKHWLAEKLNTDSFLVSDYIWGASADSIEAVKPDRSAKEQGSQIVCYNPAKGGKLVELVKTFTKKNISFIALTGMSGAEISSVLQRADLYLDLGHFPGRDRLPREAAIAGCPVLLARRGSARYHEDFPLSDDYLLDLEIETPQSVAERIERMLFRKGLHLENQHLFVESVRHSKRIFANEVGVWVRALSPTKKEMR